MKDTETYHDFLKRMGAKVQSVTLHYKDDGVTVSGATLRTCYRDGGTWRRGSTLLEAIAADDMERFFLLARKANDSKTRTGRRKTYLGGLDIPFASIQSAGPDFVKHAPDAIVMLANAVRLLAFHVERVRDEWQCREELRGIRDNMEDLIYTIKGRR